MPAPIVRPYAETAAELARRGLAVIPCPGADGKSPGGAVRGFGHWRRPPSERAIAKFTERFGDANVGVITSLSGVTVVDVDGGPDVVSHVRKCAGDTPLITATPSGGRHLWYRSNGEKNANLRRYGLPVDIKATGAGIVIVPPSFRPSSGVSYTFERGTWDSLPDLPSVDLARLVEGRRYEQLGEIKQGNRNNALFQFALREARHCDDEAALLDVLTTVNVEQEAPLSDKEVKKIAASAWGYQARGQNWVGGEVRAVIPQSVTSRLLVARHGSDALMLYSVLSQAHGARAQRGEAFAIAANAMAGAKVMGSWSAARIRNARDALLEVNILSRVHRGGRGPGDPDQFRFSTAGGEGV